MRGWAAAATPVPGCAPSAARRPAAAWAKLAARDWSDYLASRTARR